MQALRLSSPFTVGKASTRRHPGGIPTERNAAPTSASHQIVSATADQFPTVFSGTATFMDIHGDEMLLCMAVLVQVELSGQFQCSFHKYAPRLHFQGARLECKSRSVVLVALLDAKNWGL